jgi:5'-3' exonuclease
MQSINYKGTQNLISYCMNKVRMLQVNGVKCILVFDGAQLPMKSRVEKDRKKMRQESQTKAIQLWNQGNLVQANKKFMESIEIDD